MQDRVFVVNLDEYKLIGALSRALHANGNDTTYFDSFEAEYIPKEIQKFISNKNIITNIYRI